MDAERWSRLRALLEEASARPPGEREAFAAEACGDDDELRRELLALLVSDGLDTSELLPPAAAAGDPAADSSAPTRPDVAGARASASLPEQVGAYRLGGELGRGGMGVVHRATDTRDGSAAAVKILHPGLLGSERAVARFLREARAGARVRHPNVVRTLEAGVESFDGHELRWIALELVEGRDLRQLLRELGPLPEPLVLEIARQCAAALSAIHAAGIVHRDLKPENVLVTNDQRVRLTDLGIAKVLEASASLTRDGQFLGTLRYAAPEQFEGREIGPAADLYSLGVVLHELASGTNPFDREAPAAVLRAQAELEPPRLQDLRPELSPFLSEVVATLCAKRPQHRFASATVLQRVLAEGEATAWWRDRESELRARRAALPVVPVARSTALHGRRRELAALGEAWEAAVEGRGGALLLEGEAGLGKSRLVDELVRSLAGREVHVLYGSSPPSAGMRGLSEALIGKYGAVGLRSALRAQLGEGSAWADALADVVLRDEAPALHWQRAGAEAVGGAAAALLESLAADRPTLWILEDVHFAPEEGWTLAGALAHAAEGRRALVLLTARPGLDPERLERLRRTAPVQEIALERLDRGAVDELVREALHDEPMAEEIASRLGRRAEGVPLFALELLRTLRERSTAKGSGLPHAVRDLIAGRLQHLSREQREILEVAAVEGHEFDPSLVAAVLGRPRIRVLQDLAELHRRHALVRPDGPQFRFDHHLVLEVLYGELSSPLRAEYHALLAEALEAGAPERGAGGRLAVRLARHHVRGSRPASARPHLKAAFDHLESRYLNEGLLDLMQRALAPSVSLDADERFELELRRASVAERLGRRDEQRAAAEAALELAEAGADPVKRGKARCALASLLWTLAEEEEAERLARQARELALEAGEPRLELQATGVLGIAVVRQGRFAEAEELQAWCLQRAIELEEPTAEMQARGNLGQALFNQSRYLEAHEHFEAGLQIALRLDDVRAISTSSGGLGVAAWHLGLLSEAADHHERQRGISRRIGDLRSEGIGTGNVALVAIERGRVGEALELFRREEAIYERVQDRRGVPLSQANQAWANYLVGALEEAQERLDRARPVSEALEFDRLTAHLDLREGLIAHASGRPQDARRLWESGLALLRGMGDRDSSAEASNLLGRLDVEEGRLEAAAARFDESIELVAGVAGPRNLIVASCWRAGLPGGDPQAARELLVRDAALIGHVGRLEAWWALHLAEGRPEDLAEAVRHLDELVEGAPAAHRASAVERVPLHAAIRAAQGGD